MDATTRGYLRGWAWWAALWLALALVALWI